MKRIENISLANPGTGGSDRSIPRAIVIEDNPLTLWAIRQTLSSAFDIVCCCDLLQARQHLDRCRECLVICGSPVSDQHPEWIDQIASLPGKKVVALTSREMEGLPKSVVVLEKPFQLSDLLAEAQRTPAPTVDLKDPPATPEPSLMQRLRNRFEQEICPVCIHRTSTGQCALLQRHDPIQCPIQEWAERLIQLVDARQSDRLADYLDDIQSTICPNCRQSPNGRCAARDHLDCPIDLYIGLVVPIIEEELRRATAATGCTVAAELPKKGNGS